MLKEGAMEKQELERMRRMLTLLQRSSLGAPKRRRTFMEVAGIQKREITISRILAFLLDTESEHGMDELWLRSLLSAACDPELDCSGLQLAPTSCSTEAVTANVQQDLRIDVVVETPDVVVGIENKVDATLYNDLGVYAGHLSLIADSRSAVLLTLTLRDESDSTGKWTDTCNEQGVTLRNVTYAALFEKVRESFGSYMAGADMEWITFARDFMRTIENQGASDMQFDSELFDFVNDNLPEVLLLKEKLEEVTETTKDQGLRLQKLLLADEELIGMEIGKPAVYSPDKCYMYCSTYYHIPVGKRGWAHPEISNELSCMQIRSWVSSDSVKVEVRRAMAEADIPIVEEHKNHLVMSIMPLNASDEELISSLKVLIRAILPIIRR